MASIEKVGDKLHAGGDDPADWAGERGDGFFLRPDDGVIPALQTVSGWASDNGHQPAAVAIFLQVADYWLVAHALAYGCTVVTQEVPADTIRKIKIPNACIALGLRCVSPCEMLRRERVRFVPGPIRRAV